jgi:excisionase family DNA binding protein
METLVILSESDIKKWIREVIREELAQFNCQGKPPAYEEALLTRKDIAKYLNISLVTLTDWVRRGLPCIRQGRRVLFLKSEVLQAIQGRRVKRQSEPRPAKRRAVGSATVPTK